jgi:hypothetical protein
MANDDRAAAISKAAQELATAIAEIAPAENKKATADKTGKNVISVEQGFKDRDYFSGKLSEISRQLGLAGIAIIWVFRNVQGTQQAIPLSLVLPGFLLVLSLTLDFLHYFASNTLLEIFTRRAHKAGEEEFIAPFWMNYPGRIFFYGKVLLVAFAYLYLLVYLALRLILRVW